MLVNPPNDVAEPWLLLLIPLGIGIVFFLFLLIVVIESAVLQAVRWDSFRRCLGASFLMNLASTLVGVLLLFLVSRWGYWGLLLAWALSVVIEGLVLVLLKRGALKLNIKASILANLASYLILLLPTYFFSK